MECGGSLRGQAGCEGACRVPPAVIIISSSASAGTYADATPLCGAAGSVRALPVSLPAIWARARRRDISSSAPASSRPRHARSGDLNDNPEKAAQRFLLCEQVQRRAWATGTQLIKARRDTTECTCVCPCAARCNSAHQHIPSASRTRWNSPHAVFSLAKAWRGTSCWVLTAAQSQSVRCSSTCRRAKSSPSPLSRTPRTTLSRDGALLRSLRGLSGPSRRTHSAQTSVKRRLVLFCLQGGAESRGLVDVHGHRCEGG